MRVLLYRVGRNLNRAYRTCEAFGVGNLQLLECGSAKLSGNLYKAAGRVQVERVERWPGGDGLLALETSFGTPLRLVDWSRVETIVIGGETAGIPARIAAEQKATIPMFGQVSGLTVEAALAIALYEWRWWQDASE